MDKLTGLIFSHCSCDSTVAEPDTSLPQLTKRHLRIPDLLAIAARSDREIERGAGIQFRARPDASAVAVDDALHDCQPYTCAGEIVH